MSENSIHRNWKVIALCIIAIGIFLRIYRVRETQAFYGDQALDLLVANHLTQEPNPPLVRPFAAGGENTLQNSPVYFQVLALTRLATMSSRNVVYLFAIAGILTIHLAYCIGKEVENERLGLIFAVVTAVSFPLTIMSRIVWQPNLIPLVTLLCLYLLILAKKRSSAKLLVASFMVGVFGFLLHFAFAPFFLAVNFVYLWLLKDQIFTKSKKYALLLVPYAAVLAALFLGLQNKTGKVPLAPLFELDLTNLGRWPEVMRMILQWRSRPDPIFDFYFFDLGLVLAILAGLGYYFFRKKKAQRECWFPVTLLSIVLASIIPTFFSKLIFPHYLAPYFALLPLFMGLCIYYFSIHAQQLLGIAVLAVAYLNIQMLTDFRYIFDYSLTTDQDYEKLINDAIIEDYQERENHQIQTPDDFSAVILDTNDLGSGNGTFASCLNCTTSSQYLILENRFKTHFTRLTTSRRSYNNIVPVAENPKYYYLVCHHESLGFNPDKRELIDLATSNCLPKVSLMNNGNWVLKPQKTQAIIGNHSYGNAVLFVLKFELSSTSL